MPHFRTLILCALLITFGLGIQACSINETDTEPLGALSINAMDTTQGITLQEGQVLVNEVPRADRLPAVFGEVPDGEVEITVRPGLLYPPATRTVTVNAPETTFVQVNFSSDGVPAGVTIESDHNDALIVINEQLQPDLSVGTFFPVAAGQQSFSLYKEGFKTLAPALIETTLEEATEYTFTFVLEPLPAGPDEGDLFPDFTMSNDNGGMTSLAQYRGKVLLVTFWFYNCQPCREEFPYIQQLFEERSGEGFRVVGMNVGWQNDSQEDFEAIRDQLGLTFPLVFNDIGFSWTSDLQIANAPTNFILSPTGEILFRRGPITYDGLDDMIDAALADGTGE